jgi:hypothetical protein
MTTLKISLDRIASGLADDLGSQSLRVNAGKMQVAFGACMSRGDLDHTFRIQELRGMPSI